MMGKSSLRVIACEHFRTLYNARSGKLHWSDIATQIGIPIAGAFTTWLSGAKMTDVGNAVTGISIVAGLLFSMSVFLFQLRISMPDDKRLIPQDFNLIDECMKNTLWAIVWGLALALFLIITSIGGWIGSDRTGPILTGIAVGASLHFLLVIGMCLKRLHRAYERIAMRRD